MKCTECQFENPDGAKFYIECGNPMEFHCPDQGMFQEMGMDYWLARTQEVLGRL